MDISTYKDELHEFLVENSRDIDGCDYDALFEKWDKRITDESPLLRAKMESLFELLRSCGVDFLQYMSSVPDCCYYKSDFDGDVKLGGNIAEIGSWAFAKSNVRSVDMTRAVNLKSIGRRAFFDCPNITEIILPKSVEEIGAGCFRRCESLTKLYIPPTVEILPSSILVAGTKIITVYSDNVTDNYVKSWCDANEIHFEFV